MDRHRNTPDPWYFEEVTLDEAVETATQIAHDVLTRNSERVDERGEWPEENMRALQASGLGGLVVPTAAGGHGLGLVAVARVCETLGRVCPSTAISYGMHFVGSAVLAAKATPSQVDRYLVPIAHGKHLTTLALSEPGTGMHFYIPETKLARVAGGYEVTGTKSFVTNGGHADSYVISASPADASAAPGEFSCAIVDKGSPGLTWSGGWHGWGMRGNASVSANLDRVRIDREKLLGEEGDEIWFVFHVVAPFFLMAMAGTYIGIAQAALDVTRDDLVHRRYSHTGRSPIDSPLVQHRMGELWARVQRTRVLVLDSARLGDAGDPAALPALCSAKAEVAEAAERVVADAMTLVGGRGYAERSPLHRMYRDARAAHVMAPTTDLLRTWTGRAVLGLPILGDS